MSQGHARRRRRQRFLDQLVDCVSFGLVVFTLQADEVRHGRRHQLEGSVHTPTQRHSAAQRGGWTCQFNSAAHAAQDPRASLTLILALICVAVRFLHWSMRRQATRSRLWPRPRCRARPSARVWQPSSSLRMPSKSQSETHRHAENMTRLRRRLALSAATMAMHQQRIDGDRGQGRGTPIANRRVSLLFCHLGLVCPRISGAPIGAHAERSVTRAYLRGPSAVRQRS